MRGSVRRSAAAERERSATSAATRIFTVWLFYHTTEPRHDLRLLPRPALCARNQRLDGVADVRRDIFLGAQMLPHLDRPDVRAVCEQRLLARVARVQTELAKRIVEKTEPAFV